MPPRGKPRADDRRSGPAAPAEPGLSLVAMARGLAEVVAEHNLSELILDTKEITLTVRRGVASVAAPVEHVPPPPPVMMAAPAVHFPGHAPAAAAPAAAAAPDDKSH